MLRHIIFGRLSICLGNPIKNKPHCSNVITNRVASPSINSFIQNKNGLFTSCIASDLMEFFDQKTNWSEQEVKVGRSWKLEELRIKSNSDLHKLWYVLLKEKNMLLTMEYEYNRQGQGLPNPERIDKVEESMENLEKVVRERNKAYFELETGENGERPVGYDSNCFGLEYKFKMREHVIEKRYNSKFLANQKLYNYTTDHAYVKDFLARLEEKKKRIEKSKKKKIYKMACKLMRVFPHLDEEALKAQFPDLDIEAVKKDKMSRAHVENAY